MDERDKTGPKKTETLQIRIAHDTKDAFLEACRRKGESASDVLRRSILDYLASVQRPSPEHKGLLTMIPAPVRKKRYLLAGAAATLGLGLAAVLPSAAETGFRTTFERLDANHDGKLDRQEFTPMPFPGSIYARDARVNNAPGLPRDMLIVDPAVRQESAQPRRGEPALAGVDADFGRFDANGDGLVSYEEFSASLASLFRPMFEGKDANKDGVLSREEADARISISANLVTSSVHQPGALPSSDPARAFATLDRNGDGVITFDEYLPPA